ncbi:MAG: acetyl-CoA acetyltransferase [Deltaproteobacteria bacterium]|nr:acetyl-CoA acetyltransferase [Deltaproteobacteria bacterium]
MSRPVYVLGGAQTDFAVNFSRQQVEIDAIMRLALEGALDSTSIEPTDIECAHVGNFTGELFSHQGHLGGIFASLHPAFHGLPCSRHEAACASGSVAVLAAAADIECGRYDLACVLGVEQMRNVPGKVAADYLAAAAWYGREGEGATYLWPHMFSNLAEEYDQRYGLDYSHLMAIASKAFANGKGNPNAQSRKWTFTEASFTADDEANPVVEGRIRRQDCGQVTDGAAAIFLATEDYARRYASARGIALDSLPRILGWGHTTGTMMMATKLEASRGESGYMLPHLKNAIDDARERADVGLDDIDAAEVHDCFSITEYMLTEHLGLTGPGQAYMAIDAGDTAMGGKLPINPSGGLIGGGHPVGASGVRMVLDAHKQVTGTAGDYQVGGAKRVQTVNIGGSATTAVSFVVGT